jgi:hypothetical protein
MAGCGGLQRKFARKKTEETRISPVITTYDYSKELRAEELYKKHFLFWKSWQTELIDRLSGTYKKRAECYNYAIMSLYEMKKYLKEPKAAELEEFITMIKSVDPEVKEPRLSRSQQYRIGNMLESARRRIDRQFSYKKVKDYVELRKNDN